MCGHVSIFYKNDRHHSSMDEIIRNASDSIFHRGPDDVGYFNNDRVSLGFRRLSIIDVQNGHQPFEMNKMAMVFNGEIYNYLELKEGLKDKGYNFKTDSDTEVLLTAYLDMREGVLDNLVGMYSFIIWDDDEQCLFGARDIFGIKPLYYTETDDFFAFASEYKSLIELLDNKDIDRGSLQKYLSFQYSTGEDTLFDGIKKILPGHYFKIKNNKMIIQKYYKFEYTNSGQVTKDDVYNTICNSVKSHMISDVEVGTFLSGGIDSSIIAAIASKINPKIKSFSVGFGIDGYNEIDVAKKTADELGIENIQINVSQSDYIRELPNIVRLLDDPLADPSAIGIYFLSKEASKHVKVVLSGEGADELFGGYNIYKEYYSLKPFLNMPDRINSVVNKLAKSMPNIKGKNYMLRASTPLKDRYIGNAKIFENSEVQKLVGCYDQKYKYENITKEIYEQALEKGYDYVTTMQYVDMNTWLPGDILLKGDKMSMGASIELRVPFLDKNVFELSKKLSLNQKVTRKQSKVLLRDAFNDIVPKHVVQKRKLGFPTPIRVWLKQDLGDVVRKTINDANVDEIIDKNYALKLLDYHIAGKGDYSRKIWTIFIFCLWHQIFVEDLQVELSH